MVRIVTATSSTSTAGSKRRNLRPQNLTTSTLPRCVDLGQEQRRDQEPGQREEQVDAQEAALQLSGVEEHHGDDREPAQSVERRDVGTWLRTICGRLRRRSSRKCHLRPLRDNHQRLADGWAHDPFDPPDDRYEVAIVDGRQTAGGR